MLESRLAVILRPQATASVANWCALYRTCLSPLLCNVYLHRLDRAWQAAEHGVLVRYADDAIVMCATREQGRSRAGAADRPAGRARAGAQGGQDPDRACEHERRRRV
jgi:hypothetical protein